MTKRAQTALAPMPKAHYAWPDFSHAARVQSSTSLVTRSELMAELVNVHGQCHSALTKAMHEATCDAPGLYRHYREADFLRLKLEALRAQT